MATRRGSSAKGYPAAAESTDLPSGRVDLARHDTHEVAVSEPIYVQIPPAELKRLLDDAARTGAEEALRSVSDRLNRTLDLLERSGSHKATLSTREAADYADVTPDTIRAWIKRGLRAHDRSGSAGYAVRKSDLDDWIAGEETSR